MYHPGSHFAYVGGSEQINNLPDVTQLVIKLELRLKGPRGSQIPKFLTAETLDLDSESILW